MSTLQLMITVIDRNRLPQFIRLYQEKKAEVTEIALGRGTAPTELLSYLGLHPSEKAVCFSVVTDSVFWEIRKELEQKIRIDVPGTGIVFTVPLSSIGGIRELKYLTDGQNFEKKEESVMKETDHELLVVICNQGYNEQVMDAAREVGAAGGTVLHAQGTGTEKAEKFLGISLASEKEMIFIVTRTEKKKMIMQKIMEKAGLETRAKAIVFSLPVTETAGLKLIENSVE